MTLKSCRTFLFAMTVLAGVAGMPAAEKAPSLTTKPSDPAAARRGPNRDLGRQLAASFDAGDAYPDHHRHSQIAAALRRDRPAGRRDPPGPVE